MTTLHVQRFLREGGGLDDLARDYAVKSVRHAGHPNLVLLKYNQISSPMDQPIVRECRGLILDEGDDWNIVARPYDKFFNLGEPHAAEIDWSTATVQEKVDGTLCVFYYYAGWHIATTGFPDARGRANDLPITFHELIHQIAQEAELRFTSTEHSYLFELTGPHNRVVVPHRQNRLTLLGIRHNRTGDWTPLSNAGDYLTGAYRPVREHPLSSYEEMLATFSAFSPLDQEGYVVMDGAGRRVKVKHPGYVAIHLLKSSATPKRYVEVLRQGEEWELLTYFPELEATFGPIRAAYEALIAEIDADYARLKGLTEQKEFAQEALKTRSSPALFALRAGQCASAREFLTTKAQLPYILRLLNIREEDEPLGGS